MAAVLRNGDCTVLVIMTQKFWFFLLAAVLLACSTAKADDYWYEPEDTSAVNSHIGVGVMAYYPMYFEQPYLGWEVYWSLRPSEAKYFIPAFERLNVGLEVNLTFVDIKRSRNFFDASIVFHKYLSRFEGRLEQDAAFVGVGIGMLGIRWGTEEAGYRDVSFTVEMGYEYRTWKRAVVTFKAQARYLEAGSINLNGGGVGVTVGWQCE
jgi:hypothetical protein